MINLFKLIVVPILIGGILDVLHQFIRRWLDDKDDDNK